MFSFPFIWCSQAYLPKRTALEGQVKDPSSPFPSSVVYVRGLEMLLHQVRASINPDGDVLFFFSYSW